MGIDMLRRISCESGSGLIGVLVAMVLLAVGIMGLTGASMQMMGAHTEASVRATATSIAVSHMENVKRATNLSSESPTAVDESGQPDGAGDFTRSVTVIDEPSVANSKRVTVEVAYPVGRGRTRKVKLSSIVFTGN